MAPSKLPPIPVPHAELVAHLAKQGKDAASLGEIVQPYRVFEKELRSVYAQEPNHEALKDPYVNVLPLFTKDTADIKIRARKIDDESELEKSRYIMPLPAEKRKPDGAPATVKSIKEFLNNFNVFSESSLADLNWNNVVAAGSSVVNTLLPVPEEFTKSKRALREYYHEKFCPASDVDLFLYGLTEEGALEKIREIETRVKDSILTECTTVRTKHAITICSQYPTRHIQIVLRIYNSVSEILTGFDIDCAGAAFDGKQVYVTPRALQSYMTQINYIDLSRRSPSYENRLSKYSHRNFEVYWPELDRSRIDPTIFERSFRRTLGLARLLVLERLPTSSARDKYLAQRRQERGRPALNRDFWTGGLRGNIKDRHEDEVAEWVDEEEVSNYHTFTIPYGTKFHAKKIEKLCYTKDLLLNAEWNQPKEREVYLHRHPAFFGRFADVAEDCCGFCPKPHTDQEKEVAEQEDKIYVSGKVSFIKDDPGRQQIGSFNPLTEEDWCELAYVGNTARLCQAIVDCDAEHVEDWLAQEGADPNKRDYTGRTPLHLACISSTAEIVRLLVNKGARLVARLADGRTALHLAAERGNVEMVKILMDKSTENEAEEEEKKDRRRKAAGVGEAGAADKVKGVDEQSDTGGSDKAQPSVKPVESDEEEGEDEDGDEDGDDEDEDEEDDDGELIEDDDDLDDVEGQSMATGSFVQVKRGAKKEDGEDGMPEEKEDDPDFYDVNVTAWDTPCSALHLAIAGGHDEVVKLLCEEYGADVLRPVKFISQNYQPEAAVLALSLALLLPLDRAMSMTKTLLGLGATCAQADLNSFTAFQRFVESGCSTKLLDTLRELDPNGTKTSINHLGWTNYQNNGLGPLQTAAMYGDSALALKLLDAGAIPEIDFETWLKTAKQTAENRLSTLEANTKFFHNSVEQPLTMALRSSVPSLAHELLKRGANVNTLTMTSWNALEGTWWRYYTGQTALDVVREQLKMLRGYKGEKANHVKPYLAPGMDKALEDVTPGTWAHWIMSRDISEKRATYKDQCAGYEKEKTRIAALGAVQEKQAEIDRMIKIFEELEATIMEQGGKPFDELHPDHKKTTNDANTNSTDDEKDKGKQYEFKYQFTGPKDITPAREAAYIQLFEAAWAGDLEKIKSLTLAPWDEEQKEPPLMIAVNDGSRSNPFGYAFLRGHHETARGILEIAHAQYAPVEKDTTSRFTMSRGRDGDSEDYDSDEDASEGSYEADDDDDDMLRVYEHIVGGKFTIDNIGEISMQVKSRKKPMELVLDCVGAFDSESGGEMKPFVSSAKPAYLTPLSYAIRQNDMQGLRFLLDVATHYVAQKLDPEDEPTRFFTFPDNEFNTAVNLGRTEILAEVIKRTGAALPLEQLVKHTGVELKEKPKFYQGLTVYGKKRKDWAAAGRQVVRRSTNTASTAPLLRAASGANIEAVEWFLSDAPLRHYLEFSQTRAAREDTRLKHLAGTTVGGLERAITRWLGNSNDLVTHAAILSAPADKEKLATSRRLVEYLLKAYPASVITKSRDGYTPLLLACRLGRVDLVKLLIPHSDQTTRDSSWKSILHATLAGNPKAAQLRAMLDLFDPGLRTQLFKERDSLTSSEGRTPLHDWLHRAANPGSGLAYSTESEVIDVLKVLIEYSGGYELAMLDGPGDTPLHTLIARQSPPAVARVLLDFDARLVMRENAVGRTPAEVAHDMFISSRIRRPDTHYPVTGNGIYVLVNADTKAFLPPEEWELKARPDDGTASGRPLYTTRLETSVAAGKTRRQAELRDLCLEYLAAAAAVPAASSETGTGTGATSGGGKRRLVSLHEANDVAKRLGESYQGQRYYTGDKPRGDDEAAPENEDSGDRYNRYERYYNNRGGKDDDQEDFVSQKIAFAANTAWKAWKALEEEQEEWKDE